MDEPTVRAKPPPPGTLTAGSRLGKYEIIKRIAIGGMAEIFLARVTDLMSVQKVVVVKRILPALANQTEFVEMFLDEARIAATLQHPNVVQMHDVGVHVNDYFIVLEYLHGEDARSMIVAALRQDIRVPIEVALHIVCGVASGLHYAHEKVDFEGRPLKIVHRDVTPQNVVIRYDGHIKLLDFGIAKAQNRLNETRFGTLKGKVGYMSPEQALGQPLDRRSDIFTLGILLFELSLSKRLFRGKSDFDVLKQIVEEPIPRPTVVMPGYPAELERIVLKALAKDPSARYQTARDMLIELEELIRSNQMHVSTTNTAQFMERIFGQKIEAWREASTQGKTLVEILEEQTVEQDLDDDEIEIITAEDQSALRRAAAERAQLMAKIEEGRALPPEGRRPGIELTDPVDKVPRVNPWPALLVIGSVLALGGAYLWKHSGNSPYSTPLAAAPPVTIPIPVPVPTIPAAPPSAPTVTGALANTPAAAPPAPVPAKRPKARARAGKLALTSIPWVNLSIDGVDRGLTPFTGELSAGRHTISVSNPQMKIKKTFKIVIRGGKTLRKKLAF